MMNEHRAQDEHMDAPRSPLSIQCAAEGIYWFPNTAASPSSMPTGTLTTGSTADHLPQTRDHPKSRE